MHPYPVEGLDGGELLVEFLYKKNSPISGGVKHVIKTKRKMWSKAKIETELICPTSIYYYYLIILIFDDNHIF